VASSKDDTVWFFTRGILVKEARKVAGVAKVVRGGANGYGGQVAISQRWMATSWTTSLIEISNRDGDKGQPGCDGEGGKNGKAGRSAGDHGYIDCMVWFEPLYFHDDNLDVEYYDSVNDRRVWCPYKNKYAEIVRKSPETIIIQQSKNEEKNKLKHTTYAMNHRSDKILSRYDLLREKISSEFHDFVVT
jgi:hypothetical protein